MADIKVTQGSVYSLTGADAGPLKLCQVVIYGLSTLPASQINVNQAIVYGATSGETMPMSITNSSIYALAKTAYGASKVRAWGFHLDGHNFYVLRLGETETLVHDLTTNQWARWTSPSSLVFRAHRGINWQGYSKDIAEAGYAWNIVAGDSETSNLWMLDPSVGVDDHPLTGTENFRREVLGAVPMRGRDTIPVHQLYLTMDLGDPETLGTNITLLTSDNGGQNWTDHGVVTVIPGDYNQEVVWHGLGLITAPGKLFKIIDEGAAVRISSLEAR